MRMITALGVVLCVAGPALGQWQTQSIMLNPGWNAVYLEVEPEPADCQTAFAGVPIESVWAWNKEFSPVQFIQDPGTLRAAQPEWLTYFPTNHPQAFLATFFNLVGGRAYLVKLSGKAVPTTWTITGTPLVPRTTWVPDSYNLVGFVVDPGQQPTFTSYLAASAAHAGQPVYRLDATAHWVAVDTATERIMPGAAYWVKCTGPSRYAGPLTVDVVGGTELDYGGNMTEHELHIRNNAAAARGVFLKAKDSAAPPAAEGVPALAGSVPLATWGMPVTTQGWQTMPSMLVRTLQPGEEWEVRLAVRRAAMAPYTPPAGVTAWEYGSVIEVTDTDGTRVDIPVTAEAVMTHAPLPPPAVPATMRAGLWVGGVIMDKVSQPANTTQPTTPRDTASDFQMRLIVHVDSNGTARLLQHVIIAWKEGATTNDPGRFVLVSDDTKLDTLFGPAATRNVFGRRISSAAFAFATPRVMAYDAAVTSLSCSVTLDYNDLLNPFKHQYHPDHDNLDERFEQRLPDGKESFTVVRDLVLEFTMAEPASISMSGWGDTVFGGSYRETLTGLHKDKLYTSGSFALTHMTDVAVLNDGI